jgi:hypothetical protein
MATRQWILARNALKNAGFFFEEKERGIVDQVIEVLHVYRREKDRRRARTPSGAVRVY